MAIKNLENKAIQDFSSNLYHARSRPTKINWGGEEKLDDSKCWKKETYLEFLPQITVIEAVCLQKEQRKKEKN